MPAAVVYSMLLALGRRSQYRRRCCTLSCRFRGGGWVVGDRGGDGVMAIVDTNDSVVVTEVQDVSLLSRSGVGCRERGHGVIT